MDLNIQHNQDRADDDNRAETNLKAKFKKKWLKIATYIKNHKTGSIIVGILLLTVITFGIGFYLLRRDSSEPVPVTAADESTPPETEMTTSANSILTGVPVDPTVANHHPLAVIVENHTDARPQAGLDKADVVYEAFAEGGITRFMALFSSQDAEKVGPVRSIRTYFVDWAHGYNAFTGHVGGNIDALDKIKAEKINDLDQFAHPSSYWREYSTGLATEHTMFASTIKLREQADKLSYPVANNFSVNKFKDDPTTDEEKTALPESQKISIDYLSSNYNVSFQYDKTTNSYKRSMGGTTHIDRVTKSQINPKNIIAMTVSRSATKTRINEPGYNMGTIGTGKATIFSGGKVIEGTWKKPSATDRETFYDENGAEIVFNRGQFWICVVPPESSVTAQ